MALPCPDKEIIVVDDASPDRTAQILEEYGDKIRLIKHETNLGVNVGRNEGAAAARGEYLVFLDGDDLYLPWSLDLYARIIELKKPKIILCRLLFFKGPVPNPQFDDFGHSVQVVEYDALMRKDYMYRGSASAIVVDRQVFLEVGGFTKEIFPSDIDDLTIKLDYSGKTVHILSHPTTAYRIHDSNAVHQIGRFVAMSMIVRREKSGGILVAPPAAMSVTPTSAAQFTFGSNGLSAKVSIGVGLSFSREAGSSCSSPSGLVPPHP